MNTQRMNAALTAARRGWHVFPVVPGGKVSAVKAWEQRATTDPGRIRRCWSAGDFNIGIACGPSCLVVVDLDKPKPDQQPPDDWRIPGVRDGYDAFALVCERAGQPLPVDTHTVTTGRGGTHLYYQHPQQGEPLRNTSGTKGGGLGWLIDTRAHGGYVLAAGSTVNGKPYTNTWSDQLGPVPLPRWLADRLRPAPLPPQQPVTVELGTSRLDRYLDAAITRQLDHLARAGKGERNHALYQSSVALGQLVEGGALKEQEITGLLTQAAHSAFGAEFNPREVSRTITSGLRAGARRPRVVTR